MSRLLFAWGFVCWTCCGTQHLLFWLMKSESLPTLSCWLKWQRQHLAVACITAVIFIRMKVCRDVVGSVNGEQRWNCTALSSPVTAVTAAANRGLWTVSKMVIGSDRSASLGKFDKMTTTAGRQKVAWLIQKFQRRCVWKSFKTKVLSFEIWFELNWKL